MILTCPTCDTQYFAEDSTIGDAGRTVKCASCGASWFVEGTGGVVQGLSTAPAGAHQTYMEQVRNRKRSQSRTAAVTAWALSGVLFGSAIVGALVFRNQVIDRWPASAGAYQAIGFDVNRFGLDFLETNAERYFEGTMPVLNISGQVKNTSSSDRVAPQVRVSLLDDKGRAVAVKHALISPGTIGAGQTGEFDTRIENPPFEAFALELTFATGEQVAVLVDNMDTPSK